MKDIILIGHGAIGAHMDTTTCKDPLKGRAYPGGKAKRRERRKAERSSKPKRKFK